MLWRPRGRSEWGDILTPPGVHDSTRLTLPTLSQHKPPPTWGARVSPVRRPAPQTPEASGVSRQSPVLQIWASWKKKKSGLQRVWSGLRAEKRETSLGSYCAWGLGTGRGLLWFESSTSAKGGNRRLSYLLVGVWSTMGRGRVRFKSYQYTHWGNQNWKRHVYPNVHRSTVYNSQDMEAT